MRWIPRITAAGGLVVLAYLHLDVAPVYDAVGVVVSQGILLRGVAAFALVAAVVVLQFDHLVAYVTGLLAACLAAVMVMGHGWAGSAAGPSALVAVLVTGYLVGAELPRWRAHRLMRIGIGAFLLGGLPPDEAAATEAHLTWCPGCRSVAAELAPVAVLLKAVTRTRA